MATMMLMTMTMIQIIINNHNDHSTTRDLYSYTAIRVRHSVNVSRGTSIILFGLHDAIYVS